MNYGEICPTCSAMNDCRLEKGENTCWCFAMPHVLPVRATEGDGRCYCRACLTRVIGEQTPGSSEQLDRPQ